MIKIRTPNHLANCQSYVCNFVFKERLGQDYEILFSEDIATTSIEFGLHKIQLPDLFFPLAKAHWLQQESLPNDQFIFISKSQFRFNYKSIENDMPIIYGDGINSEISISSVYLPIDILGSIFFMLTRYEEATSLIRDAQDRFPLSASCLFQHKLWRRPLVDEYVELLWGAIKNLAPNLERTISPSLTRYSCDVDSLYSYHYMRPVNIAKELARNIIRERSPKKVIETLNMTHKLWKHGVGVDPVNTYDFIMDVCEKQDIKASFYFICDNKNPIDGNYTFTEKDTQSVFQKIIDREHDVGLHGSYCSYNNKEQLQSEFNILQRSLNAYGAKRTLIGGRQHILRWDPKCTWKIWSDVGLDYDTTVGYAEAPGFRCGTSSDFNAFSLADKTKLPLMERPLIAMEFSLAASKYMNMGYSEEMLSELLDIKKLCHFYGGNFNLLWHNSNFPTGESREIFKQILESKP